MSGKVLYENKTTNPTQLGMDVDADAISENLSELCQVTRSVRNGQPFIEVFPRNGGWIGFYLEDGMGDWAPFGG